MITKQEIEDFAVSALSIAIIIGSVVWMLYAG